MFRLGVFCVVALVLASACKCSPIDSDVKFAIVHNLTTFLNENPDVKLLHPLVREELSDDPSSKLVINYRLGNRIGGDRLVATADGSQSWGSPQEVKLTLTYPRTGVGAVVTFIQVVVEQSTNLGRGYVTSGGIGQRQITVVIEGQQTLYFRYNAEIYGY